jgi:hypothetical protein
LHGGFDFRSGKALGGGGDPVQIVVGGIAFAFGQLDGKDLFALGCTGQVHEEEFVEAAFAD